jgi:hypothetical protein
MPRLRHTHIALVALAALTVACSSAGRSSPAASPTPVLAACAAANLAPATALPSGVPASLPLPPGTYVTGGRTDGDQVAVDALVPGTLSVAAAFMTQQLPAAGFKLTDSDAEQDEAEARFSGNGVSGRLRLHSITGCNDAVTLTVAVSPG